MVTDGASAQDAWALTDVITRLRRSLRSSVRSDVPWESLPMAQVELLQRLAEEPGLGVSELAERQRLARNTVSNLAQQMVAAGLLERRGRDDDRRAVTLTLTDFGREQHAAWRRANEDRVHDALQDLGDEERAAITSALPALRLFAARLESRAAQPVQER
ncbi:MAG TPA: MarR family winged helix-turn-helix transcriptional regulator [Microbacterium sp.]|uniref:MarR family winged helix-turn-helix transcriptional regulator n=1 Tax=Microbacterium sp. TaxID=51671 RepID=UPI002B48EC5A|nr:MarR family winged helix-turn-helix transcriptional regulator [Microbacterium sp.]HKT56682.1 MarR family winged helix-turn-helix transcriptional regulator [Microbacterium sp.]